MEDQITKLAESIANIIDAQRKDRDVLKSISEKLDMILKELQK